MTDEDGWGGHRRDGSAPGPDPSAGWDEVDGSGGQYDPSPRPWAREPWDTGAPPPYHDDGPGQYMGPRYSFAPAPPAYPPPYAYPYPYPYPPIYHPPNPSLPVAGGICTILAGVIGLLWSFVFFGFGSILPIGMGLGWCMVVQLACSAVAIVGGIFALARRVFPLAVTGAVLAMLVGGFTGFAFVLGLIGLILIVIGRDAFLPPGWPTGPWR